MSSGMCYWSGSVIVWPFNRSRITDRVIACRTNRLGVRRPCSHASTVRALKARPSSEHQCEANTWHGSRNIRRRKNFIQLGGHACCLSLPICLPICDKCIMPCGLAIQRVREGLTLARNTLEDDRRRSVPTWRTWRRTHESIRPRQSSGLDRVLK